MEPIFQYEKLYFNKHLNIINKKELDFAMETINSSFKIQ